MQFMYYTLTLKKMKIFDIEGKGKAFQAGRP